MTRTMPRILTIVGARPQFIKAALVSEAMDGRCDEIVVHTGQHYDAMMSQAHFDDLRMRAPRHHLDVGSGSHGEQTAEMLRRGAVLVADSHRRLLDGGYGLADRATRTGNTPQTRFCIASIGKLFTAVAIAQLVQQHQRIGRYIERHLAYVRNVR